MSTLSQTRVLIIDDEAEMAQLIALMLHDSAVELLIAQDGKTGLEKALQENPDVIITDLMMPEVDGFTLMEKVLEQSPNTPIIVVTAYGSMKSAIQALRLGAFDFITKPFSKADVQKTVAKAARTQIAQKQDLWRQMITSILGVLRNPVNVAEKFLTLCSNALNAEYGLIWWLNEATPPLRLATVDEALADQFITWAKAVGLNNVVDYEPVGRVIHPLQSDGDTSYTGSVIGVPMITHNDLEGVLILGDTRPNYFSEDDLTFLDSMMPFAALTLDNAKTYTKLEASNRRLASLQRISALTYNANLPLNRTLRLITEGIRQNLGYAGVTICLPEKASGNLIIRTAAGDLDRYLRRQGDTPTRRIAFPFETSDDLFSLAYRTKNPKEGPIDLWVEALRSAGVTDMAQALTKIQEKHYIALPLWQGEQVIGVLGVAHTHPEALPADERSLLNSIASQVSLIINNVSLYQAEQQGRREMEALYQAGLVITSSLSHADVLTKIIEQIVDLTLFESCIIGRWNPLRNTEVIEQYREKTPAGWLEKEPPGTVYSLTNRPLVREAVESRSLKVVRPDDPDLHPVERAWMEESGVKTRAIIPLIVRDRSIGVVELMTQYPGRQFTETISRVAQGLASQAAIALENASLHESELRRVEQELELAHRIQVSLLPHEIPQVPGLSIAARSVSARQVGGDFYRYLTLPDGKFGVVVGDVSGKGVPSALFMAITITAMDTQIRQSTTPGHILRQLNAILYPRMQANHMNTGLLIAIFDPQNQTVQVANAGMIAPLIRAHNGYDWVDVYGLPIGAVSDTSYASQTITMTADTTVILTSDGIIEAKNYQNEMFGFERFYASAQQVAPATPSQQVLENLWTDVAGHIGDAEPHDDMTLVVIRSWGLGLNQHN